MKDWPKDPDRSQDSIRRGARRGRRFLIPASLAVIGLLGVAAAGLIAYQYYSADLPRLDTLADYEPNIVTVVYDVNMRVMGEFKYENQRRFVLPIDEVPPLMIDAFIAVEDEHFFEHKGLDYLGILRATLENLRGGAIRQGASTITQQVCRSLLLTPEKTWERKIKEAILAFRIEARFSKEEILFLYLNQIYFGHGAYGVEAAARSYFGKSVGELTVGETTLLAGLPQAPARHNPYHHPEAAKRRRKHVLERMVAVGKIDRATARAAASEELRLVKPSDLNKTVAPYFTEYVRRYLMKKYGAKTVLKEGLRVITTCDLDLQDHARKALRDGLEELARRQGYSGPLERIPREGWEEFRRKLTLHRGEGKPAEGQIYKALVLSANEKIARVDIGGMELRLGPPGIRWVEKIIRQSAPGRFGPFQRVNQVIREGEVILVRIKDAAARTCFLHQKPRSQAAILAMDPHSRRVLAVVGGYDYRESEFNRAVQALRQPGSSFKPLVYAAALDAGLTTATQVMDTALVFADGWKPRNYGGKFSGEITLRQALAKSVNTATIRVAQMIGPKYIEAYARRLGLASLAGSDLSMALGSYEVLPVELINAYAVFASGGQLADPIFIAKMVDRHGRVLEDNSLSPRIEVAPPMTTRPALDAPRPRKTPEEGVDELLAFLNSPGRREFLEDFDLAFNLRGLGKKSPSSAPPMLKDIPMPRFHRDEEGRIIRRQVISPQTAFLITSMLQTVAERGTGAKTRVLGKTVAGKTGTTNNNVDAWFIGFSPDLLVGVWVGNDSGSSSLGRGETGSKAALPIWLKFTEKALASKADKPFPVPSGVETVTIDPRTGLRAYEGQKDSVEEYFKSGTGPVETAPKPGEPDPDGFFQVDF